MNTTAGATPIPDQVTEPSGNLDASTIEAGSADPHGLYTLIEQQPFFKGLAHALPELSQFARRHGLSLIFNTGELEDQKFSSAANDLHKHEVSLTPRLDYVLEQPRRGDYQHWGINE